MNDAQYQPPAWLSTLVGMAFFAALGFIVMALLFRWVPVTREIAWLALWVAIAIPSLWAVDRVLAKVRGS